MIERGTVDEKDLLQHRTYMLWPLTGIMKNRRKYFIYYFGEMCANIVEQVNLSAKNKNNISTARHIQWRLSYSLAWFISGVF